MRKIVLAAYMAVLLVPQAAEADENIGQWAVTHSTDSMSDQSTTTITVFGKDGGFAVQCTASARPSYAITFVHLPFLGAGDRLIQYRFDEDAPISQPWHYTTNAAVLLSAVDIPPLLARLATSKRLRIRASTITFQPADADFDVTGADEALAKLNSECAGAAQSK